MTRRLAPLAMGLLVTGLMGLPVKTRGAEALQFLTVPVGARAAALGDAGVSLSDDADALFLNPAALARAPWGSVSLGGVPYPDDTRHTHAAASRHLGRWGGLGVGASFVSYGDVDTLDAEGSPSGQLSPQDWQATAGYGRHFPPWPVVKGYAWGVSGEYISTSLVHTAQTTALGLGLLSPPYQGGKWMWGLSAIHLGPGIKVGESRESLPRTYRAGVAWRPSATWRVVSDLDRQGEEDLRLGAGIEYQKPIGSKATFALRAGYHQAPDGSTWTDELRVGFGATWGTLRVDYFLKGFTRDGMVQGVTVGFLFFEKGRGLPPALQALVDRGRRQLEGSQFPEAVLTFYEALQMDPNCQEARDGMERAQRRMTGR